MEGKLVLIFFTILGLSFGKGKVFLLRMRSQETWDLFLTLMQASCIVLNCSVSLFLKLINCHLIQREMWRIFNCIENAESFQTSSVPVARNTHLILWLLLQFGGYVFPSNLAQSIHNLIIAQGIVIETFRWQLIKKKKRWKESSNFNKGHSTTLERQHLFFCKQQRCIASDEGTADWSRHGSVVSGLKGNSKWHEPGNMHASSWNLSIPYRVICRDRICW